MTQEARCIDVFGPNLFLETGGSQVGVAGKTAYTLQAQNSSGVKYNQGLYESGLSRQYAEKTLQVECGAKNKSGDVSYMLVAHKGDLAMNADKGFVRIKGQQIVLEAADELVLQSRKIRIGYEEEGRTQTIDIIGSDVELTSTGGNLADLLGTSNIFQAFAGSLIGDKINDLVKGVTLGIIG